MDEFITIAIWFLIGILSVNAMVLYLDSTDTFVQNGLSLGLDSDRALVFDSGDVNASISASSTASGNLVTSEAPSNPIELFFAASTSIQSFIGWILRIYFAWFYLLSALTASMPGGAFFLVVIAPIIGMFQIVATTAVLMRAINALTGLLGLA